MNYSDKLKDPRWQRRRLEILNLHEFKCEKCGCEDKELHVHHRFYLKGREVWEYDNDVFQVLCVDCHEKEHKKVPKIVEVIPKKYEELIKNIESFGDVDLSNLNCFLHLLDDSDMFNETFDLLYDAVNCNRLDSAMEILRDKRTIENLEIQIETMCNDFNRKIEHLEEKTGFKYEYERIGSINNF